MIEDMPYGTVRKVMATLGAGEVTAEQVRAAYVYARGARAQRTPWSNMVDPDAASDPTEFVSVAAARQAGVITAEQYEALGDALAGH